MQIVESISSLLTVNRVLDGWSVEIWRFLLLLNKLSNVQFRGGFKFRLEYCSFEAVYCELHIMIQLQIREVVMKSVGWLLSILSWLESYTGRNITEEIYYYCVV